MYLAQTGPPTLPDTGALKDLSPPVAITLLVVIALVTFLFYFGGSIRDRLGGKKTETPPAVPAAVVAAPVAAPAVEQANTMANEVIAELRERNRVLERQLSLHTQRIEELRDEVEQLRLELQRARLRGGRGEY